MDLGVGISAGPSVMQDVGIGVVAGVGSRMIEGV